MYGEPFTFHGQETRWDEGIPGALCPWCRNPDAIEPENDEDLCRIHRAEFHGLSVSELMRMESEQAAEWADTL